MTRHYVDKTQPEMGSYEILSGPEGAFWQWREVANGVEYDEDGRLWPTVPEALRDAADDWEKNGNGANRRLGRQLRAAATRAERKLGES